MAKKDQRASWEHERYKGHKKMMLLEYQKLIQ